MVNWRCGGMEDKKTNKARKAIVIVSLLIVALIIGSVISYRYIIPDLHNLSNNTENVTPTHLIGNYLVTNSSFNYSLVMEPNISGISFNGAEIVNGCNTTSVAVYKRNQTSLNGSKSYITTEFILNTFLPISNASVSLSNIKSITSYADIPVKDGEVVYKIVCAINKNVTVK